MAAVRKNQGAAIRIIPRRGGRGRTTHAIARGLLLAVVLIGGLALTAPPARATISLTPISTGFNGLIGIDHHEPTNQVIVSVNYPTGVPHNFELVGADGTRTPFSSISGFTNEVKIGAVRKSACQGGFTPGEVFTGTGVEGVVARISPDGTSVLNPWVTLPSEIGLIRGSLFQDRYCAFGGDLIVVTTVGNVWRITAAGVATRVWAPLLDVFIHLEGLTTVPNEPSRYGPWAATILAGAEGLGCILSITAAGNATCWSLGINPEDIDIIPANENFFGVDFGSQILWGAPPSEFSAMVGDILVAQEFPGQLFHVRWDAGTQTFVSVLVAEVAQWEHVTFSRAGIQEIPGVGDECPLSHGFWKNHPEDWPTDSLALGGETYNQTELLALLRAPSKGDASLILARQLIAAKLNVANGSDPAPIAANLTEADALLGGFPGKLPYGVTPSSPIGQQMTALAEVLGDFNNGLLTPNCECDDGKDDDGDGDDDDDGEDEDDDDEEDDGGRIRPGTRGGSSDDEDDDDDDEDENECGDEDEDDDDEEGGDEGEDEDDEGDTRPNPRTMPTPLNGVAVLVAILSASAILAGLAILSRRSRG